MKFALKFICLLAFVALCAGQCKKYNDIAKTVVDAMNSKFYAGGVWRDGWMWTDANALEDINNLHLANGWTNWEWLNHQSQLGGMGSNPNTNNWVGFLQGSYDDAAWIVLAMFRMADYAKAHGKNGDAYMRNAAVIYDWIQTGVDGTCGGGMWWSGARQYKNAITNHLWLMVSGSFYLRTKTQRYKDNAITSWNWIKHSDMRNGEGLYIDGLNTATCKNNGYPIWTYNQGVVASGLAALAQITGDKSLLDQAEITLDATVARMTDNGVLKERCDGPHSDCNHDQQIFKGLFVKHLQYYLDMANDSKRTAKYRDFINKQAQAVLANAKNPDNTASNSWFVRGGATGYQGTTSMLAVLNAAAKYGSC